MTVVLCAGCAASTGQDMTAPPPRTGGMTYLPGRSSSANILGQLWEQYAPEERFSVYGGMMEYPVADAPGDLDMEQPFVWGERLCLPIAHGRKIISGAAMSHLMNGNLWTVAVFEIVQEQDIGPVARDWRQELQSHDWVGGKPARLMLVREEEHLLVAYGSQGHMKILKEKIPMVFPGAELLYDESITA